MKDKFDYFDVDKVVAFAKDACGVTKPNSELTHDEIRSVVRWIGGCAPDTVYVDGKVIFGRMGIELMLFVTLMEFSEYYKEYGLSQFN